MADPRTTNRKMFWRIIRRLLIANPGRLFVMLLALGAGAAVTAALLNLRVDAKRRLTTEFRAFGANVVIAPGDFGSGASSTTLDESVVDKVAAAKSSTPVSYAGFLYGVVDAGREPSKGKAVVPKTVKAILVGYFHSDFRPEDVLPKALIVAEEGVRARSPGSCFVGRRVGVALEIHTHDGIVLANGNRNAACTATILPSSGGPEDDQIFLKDLLAAQALLQQRNRISLIQLNVGGASQEILKYVDSLRLQVPGADVRPIRQFTEGEAKIYNRISGLLTATVGIVLLLTALCLMAAMTNVAMERRMDVGLMKAIGGATRRVLRLFLAEAALLGLAGGLIGAAAGIFLSIGLGKAVFGIAARPRLIVYPLTVALTIIVAILSAFPLRRLTGTRPASVFRGEA
jgi:putative ABC transport system permease protein